MNHAGTRTGAGRSNPRTGRTGRADGTGRDGSLGWCLPDGTGWGDGRSGTYSSDNAGGITTNRGLIRPDGTGGTP